MCLLTCCWVPEFPDFDSAEKHWILMVLGPNSMQGPALWDVPVILTDPVSLLPPFPLSQPCRLCLHFRLKPWALATPSPSPAVESPIGTWSGALNSLCTLIGCWWPNSTPEHFLQDLPSRDGWNASMRNSLETTALSSVLWCTTTKALMNACTRMGTLFQMWNYAFLVSVFPKSVFQ